MTPLQDAVGLSLLHKAFFYATPRKKATGPFLQSPMRSFLIARCALVTGKKSASPTLPSDLRHHPAVHLVACNGGTCWQAAATGLDQLASTFALGGDRGGNLAI